MLRQSWWSMSLALLVIPSFAVPAHAVALARPLAMGQAYRAAGAANGAIYANPAGMSRLTMYSIEWAWLRGDQGGDDDTFALSVVDTKTQAFGVGVGYSYVPGDTDRHDGRLALSYPMVPRRLHGGATFRYLALDPPKGDLSSAVAVDSGLVAEVGGGFMLGVAGHNLLPDPALADTSTRTWGLGLAWEGGQFSVAFDAVRQPSTAGSSGWDRQTYHAGLEWMLVPKMAVRGGWSLNPLHDDDPHRLSMGIGWITGAGALDFAYRQGGHGAAARSLVVGLRSFL